MHQSENDTQKKKVACPNKNKIDGRRRIWHLDLLLIARSAPTVPPTKFKPPGYCTLRNRIANFSYRDVVELEKFHSASSLFLFPFFVFKNVQTKIFFLKATFPNKTNFLIRKIWLNSCFFKLIKLDEILFWLKIKKVFWTFCLKISKKRMKLKKKMFEKVIFRMKNWNLDVQNYKRDENVIRWPIVSFVASNRPIPELNTEWVVWPVYLRSGQSLILRFPSTLKESKNFFFAK